jgi:ParB family chromosome partitioning protein
MTSVELSKIQVGDRVRRRIGDLSKLKESIQDVGLLVPLLLDGDLRLVAGWRRLQALKDLGHSEAPAVIIERLKDARLHLVAERDENICRESMNGFEEMEMSQRLLALEKPKARERQTSKLKRGNSRPRSETVSEREGKGEALQQVASAIGVSAPSIRKGLAAVEAYKRDPKKYEAVKPALEAKQWGKAARVVKEADDPYERPRKPKPGEQLHEEMIKIHSKLEKLWDSYPRNRDMFLSELSASLQSFKSRKS